jgi:hypothetical protein
MTKPGGRRELGTHSFSGFRLSIVNPGSTRRTKFTADAEIRGHGNPLPR